MAENAQSQYYNQQAASLAAQVANQAAQLEFQRMRFQQLELPQYQDMSALEKEKLAFTKATEAWNQAYRESAMTGTYQGRPITEFLLAQAQLTGTMQTAGTLTGDQQRRYNQLREAQAKLPAGTLLGDADLRELEEYQKILGSSTPTQTLAAQAQQAALSGMYQGQMTPEYAQMVASMTGQFGGAQTQAAQQQAFAQQMALAGLTGQVGGTGPGGIGGIGGAGGIGGVGGVGGLGGGDPYAGMTQAAREFAQQFGLNQAAVTGTYGVPGQLSPQQQARAQQILARDAQLRAAGEGGVSVEDQAELQAYQNILSGTGNQQQTMQARELERRFGLDEGTLTGMYNGQQTQAAKEFAQQFGLQEAGVTGYYGGQTTLERETAEAGQANQLLQLAASLRGPRNAFQFAQVLGGTPGGLSDMLNSVAGRYNLPTFQGGGQAPQAVNLQNFVQDVGAATRPGWGAPGMGTMPGFGAQPVGGPGTPGYVRSGVGNTAPNTGYSQGGPTASGGWANQESVGGGYNPRVGQWGTSPPSYQTNPPGAQAPSNAYNYQPSGDGSNYVYPPGISAPVQAGQISSQAPLSATNLQQIGASTLAQQPYALPSPTTWNAENYNNLGTYRQDLLKAAYESSGWDVGAVEDQFKKSLPKTSGPQTGAIKGII